VAVVEFDAARDFGGERLPVDGVESSGEIRDDAKRAVDFQQRRVEELLQFLRRLVDADAGIEIRRRGRERNRDVVVRLRPPTAPVAATSSAAAANRLTRRSPA
jgi:hypothetical protein